MKEHPRYNVVSFRLTDDEMKQFEMICGKRTQQETMNLILSGVFKKYREVTGNATTQQSRT
jgi:hypothetical protein